MPTQDVADGVATGECLMNFQGGSTRVGKDGVDPLALQRLHQNV